MSGAQCSSVQGASRGKGTRWGCSDRGCTRRYRSSVSDHSGRDARIKETHRGQRDDYTTAYTRLRGRRGAWIVPIQFPNRCMIRPLFLTGRGAWTLDTAVILRNPIAIPGFVAIGAAQIRHRWYRLCRLVWVQCEGGGRVLGFDLLLSWADVSGEGRCWLWIWVSGPCEPSVRSRPSVGITHHGETD